MENKMMEAKAAIVAVMYAVAAALGWKGILAVIWLVAMVLDYVSGTAAACRAKQWSSETARDGLWHKGGMIFVVLCATLADLMFSIAFQQFPEIGFEWPGAIMPVVLAWYILTETGSVLENAEKMGAPVPKWLTKMLKQSLKAVDDKIDNENQLE